MSDDWQVGDLAVCLHEGPWRHARSRTTCCLPCPGLNEICRVRRIGHDVDGALGLWLDGYEGEAIEFAFDATRFRKVRPDAHEGDADDWELILDSVTRRVDA